MDGGLSIGESLGSTTEDHMNKFYKIFFTFWAVFFTIYYMIVFYPNFKAGLVSIFG